MCGGFQQYERERLKIKSFHLRLSLSDAPKKPSCLPDSLTLYYLPRISGSPLDVDGSKIRPDSPAFVTLHQLVSSADTAGAIYGSRERVRASEGVRFEVYLRDEKVLKGIFRKDEDDDWKLECKCALERDLAGLGVEVKEAEVCVAVEGHVAMAETVEMVVKRKRRVKYCFQGLEEIPEEREDDTESDGCYSSCSCSDGEIRSDGGGCADEIDENRREEVEVEMEMEGVRWAVDVGIWVMCLGVGFLVSKASSKTLRPRRLL